MGHNGFGIWRAQSISRSTTWQSFLNHIFRCLHPTTLAPIMQRYRVDLLRAGTPSRTGSRKCPDAREGMCRTVVPVVGTCVGNPECICTAYHFVAVRLSMFIVILFHHAFPLAVPRGLVTPCRLCVHLQQHPTRDMGCWLRMLYKPCFLRHVEWICEGGEETFNDQRGWETSGSEGNAHRYNFLQSLQLTSLVLEGIFARNAAILAVVKLVAEGQRSSEVETTDMSPEHFEGLTAPHSGLKSACSRLT